MPLRKSTLGPPPFCAHVQTLHSRVLGTIHRGGDPKQSYPNTTARGTRAHLPVFRFFTPISHQRFQVHPSAEGTRGEQSSRILRCYSVGSVAGVFFVSAGEAVKKRSRSIRLCSPMTSYLGNNFKIVVTRATRAYPQRLNGISQLIKSIFHTPSHSF